MKHGIQTAVTQLMVYLPWEFETTEGNGIFNGDNFTQNYTFGKKSLLKLMEK